jgi:hypothetical protein
MDEKDNVHPGQYPLPWTGEPVHKFAQQMLDNAFANDEPVFILRAKDFFAPQVVAKYLELIETVGPINMELQEDVTKVMNAMREWQGTHMGQVRYPD